MPADGSLTAMSTDDAVRMLSAEDRQARARLGKVELPLFLAVTILFFALARFLLDMTYVPYLGTTLLMIGMALRSGLILAKRHGAP